MPGAGGKVGALTVESGGKQAVLDQPYAAVRVKESGLVEPGSVTEQEARQAFGAALAAQPGRPTSFVLYFLENRDELTPDSKQTLGSALDEIARRPAPEIVVIGHTDRVGPVPYNDTLSLRPAARLRDELVKVGIAADRIRVAGRGERAPPVPAADEVAEPRDRRVGGERPRGGGDPRPPPPPPPPPRGEGGGRGAAG